MAMSSSQINLRETQMLGAGTREWVVSQDVCPFMADFNFMWTGVSEAAYGFLFVRHNPLWDSVRFTISGEGEVWLDGKWQSCKPGSAYLTPAGHPHAYRAFRNKPWTLCWVRFVTSAAGKVVTADKPALWDVDPRSVHSAILGLHAECSGPQDPLMMRRWLDLINLSVIRAVSSRQAVDRLWQLWAEVEGRLGHPWSREDLASFSGMSGENLRLICQAQYGRSPLQQLTHLRMHRAASLLKATSYKIPVIAKAVGYSNAFSFSTAFARWAGSSPSQYRKRQNT